VESIPFHFARTTTEATSRGLVTRNARQFRWLNAGRPWGSPLMWKDFYFSAGGIAALFVRFAMYIALYFYLRCDHHDDDRPNALSDG